MADSLICKEPVKTGSFSLSKIYWHIYCESGFREEERNYEQIKFRFIYGFVFCVRYFV